MTYGLKKESIEIHNSSGVEKRRGVIKAEDGVRKGFPLHT